MNVRLIILSAFTLLILSCNKNSKDFRKPDEVVTYERANYLIINDEIIINSINEYIKEYELNGKESYIVIEFRISSRPIVSITYSDTPITKNSKLPLNHSFVNGFLVLIFSDIDYLNVNDLNNGKLQFYENIIFENEIVLFDSDFLKHPPVWTLLGDCETNKYTLIKKSRRYGYSLPCGYIYRRGTTTATIDSLWIESVTIDDLR